MSTSRTTIMMKGYRILGSPSDLRNAKIALLTIDRGLYDTEHNVLRGNVSSLRHDLTSVKYDDKMRRRVEALIESFNQLDVSTLNTALLDDKSLPMEATGVGTKEVPLKDPTGNGETSGTDDDDEQNDQAGTTPAKPAATTSDELPSIDKRFKEVNDRLDGHDHRHENAEANLKALNGAVGITQNPDGAWVPTPGGQFDRNAKVQEHLGYERDKDGNVTFLDRSVTVAGQDFKIGAAIVTLFVALIIIYLVMGASFGWFSIQSLVVAPILSLIVAAVALLYFNRNA